MEARTIPDGWNDSLWDNRVVVSWCRGYSSRQSAHDDNVSPQRALVPGELLESPPLRPHQRWAHGAVPPGLGFQVLVMASERELRENELGSPLPIPCPLHRHSSVCHRPPRLELLLERPQRHG